MLKVPSFHFIQRPLLKQKLAALYLKYFFLEKGMVQTILMMMIVNFANKQARAELMNVKTKILRVRDFTFWSMLLNPTPMVIYYSMDPIYQI